jgi:hypothetical protein
VWSVPREEQERIREITLRRILLSPELRWDLAFAIHSQNWDTFASWEWDAEHCAGYLSE